MTSARQGHGKARSLRSGFTTGACAAAAAKAAALLLLQGTAPAQVEIPFPQGDRHAFAIYWSSRRGEWAWASVIKDAGDDPDVTNGAEIRTGVRPHMGRDTLVFSAGAGVGQVTKPGLAVAVGEPAINPVPRQMIAAALAEVKSAAAARAVQGLEVRVSVPHGQDLARKTLNQRLGIVGGLSILGTTGIVRPISAAAWTATIEAAMRVARAQGLDQVVLSTGRSSEQAARAALPHLPEEAFVMMGDYLAFALEEAARQEFTRIHFAPMWAKALKAALGLPQTHVRHGALEPGAAAAFLRSLSRTVPDLEGANTARELYHRLIQAKRKDLVRAVCLRARDQAMARSGLPVEVWLVGPEGEVVCHV